MTTAAESRFEPRRLTAAGLLTLFVSLAAVLAIRAIADAIVSVPAAFTPLSLGSVISLTVLGVAAATIVCFVLNRLSANPIRAFRRLVPAALALSFLPDIATWASGAYQGTATASTVIPLMLMHIAVATTCYLILPYRGRTAVAGHHEPSLT